MSDDHQSPAGPDQRVEAEVTGRASRGSRERRLMQAGGPGCIVPALSLVVALVAASLVLAA